MTYIRGRLNLRGNQVFPYDPIIFIRRLFPSSFPKGGFKVLKK